MSVRRKRSLVSLAMRCAQDLPSSRANLDIRYGTIYHIFMTEPTKTTIYLDPEDYRRMKALARSQGRTAAELVREAVAEYARAHPLPSRAASIGAGRSGRGDVSERAEELLDGMGESR